MMRCAVAAALVSTSAAIVTAGVGVGAEGDEPVIHFVVDVSGSMQGTKINEAVEAIKVTAEAVPDSTALGLRSYAGSCDQSSVEPLVPIGVDNDEAIIAAADGLIANGGTPTTAALDEGIDELLAYPSSGEKRLVLLTDGDTGCGITICDFIRQKDPFGIQLTLFTVGLQVSSTAASDLSCAAGHTGGSYIPADSPEDLVDALGEATGSTQIKYVALGDSFSAGEGVEPFYDANRCHRSKLAYAHFVEVPGRPGQTIWQRSFLDDRVQWGFQACSGAIAKNVLQTGRFDDPLAQLDPDRSGDLSNRLDLPVDEATDLVTITIGGNDLEFAEVLKFCAFSPDCTTEKFRGRRLDLKLRELRDDLSPQLDEIYARIHQQAPNARILVLGYPQLFPKSEDEQRCGKLAQRLIPQKSGPVVTYKTLGFSTTEQNYLRQATSEANQLIAARVEASEVATFVPVDEIFDGHEVCGHAGEWVNAPTLTRQFKVNDQAFHPNEVGHEHGYAEAINRFLNPLPEF